MPASRASVSEPDRAERCAVDPIHLAHVRGRIAASLRKALEDLPRVFDRAQADAPVVPQQFGSGWRKAKEMPGAGGSEVREVNDLKADMRKVFARSRRERAHTSLDC